MLKLSEHGRSAVVDREPAFCLGQRAVTGEGLKLDETTSSKSRRRAQAKLFRSTCNIFWRQVAYRTVRISRCDDEIGLPGKHTTRAATVFTSALAMILASTSPGGTWARYPETTAVQGEFDNDDPVALAHGAISTTDCGHHLGIGEKTYCFESDNSLHAFQQDPGLLLKAESFWSKRHRP